MHGIKTDPSWLIHHWNKLPETVSSWEERFILACAFRSFTGPGHMALLLQVCDIRLTGACDRRDLFVAPRKPRDGGREFCQSLLQGHTPVTQVLATGLYPLLFLPLWRLSQSVEPTLNTWTFVGPTIQTTTICVHGAVFK